MTKERRDYLKQTISNRDKDYKELKQKEEESQEYCLIVNGGKPRELTEQEKIDFTVLDVERLKLWRRLSKLDLAIELLTNEEQNILDRLIVKKDTYLKTSIETYISERQLANIVNSILEKINSYID